jgi:hypothetical protein
MRFDLSMKKITNNYFLLLKIQIFTFSGSHKGSFLLSEKNGDLATGG